MVPNQKVKNIVVFGFLASISIAVLVYSLLLTGKDEAVLIKLLFTSSALVFIGCMLNQFDACKEFIAKAIKLLELDKIM